LLLRLRILVSPSTRRLEDAAMGEAGLVDLARKFVALSDELATVRSEIARAVLN
jgi:hypothetical protein